MYKILWPELRMVDGDQLRKWASDDLYNEYGEERRWEDLSVDEAIDVLQETGSVTLGEIEHGDDGRRTEREERLFCSRDF